MDEAEITIAILHYGRLGKLKACIQSIFSFTEMPFKIHIICQGEESAIGREHLLAPAGRNHPNISITKLDENIGIVKGMELMVEKCGTQYLYRMDDDILCTPGWLWSVHTLMKQHLKTAAAGHSMIQFINGLPEFKYPYDFLVDLEKGTIKTREIDHLKVAPRQCRGLHPGAVLYNMDIFRSGDIKLDTDYQAYFASEDLFMQLWDKKYLVYAHLLHPLIHLPGGNEEYMATRFKEDIRDKDNKYFKSKWGYEFVRQ